MTDPFAKDDLPLPDNDATSQEKVRYLREFVRLYARDLAMRTALHLIPEWEAGLEITVAVIERGDRIDASSEQKLMARDAEWKACIAHASATLEKLRSVLRKLAWERAPGAEMLNAAERTLREERMFAPQEAIVALAREIAHSTVRQGGRRVA